jgi:DnaK suppressor protein
MKEVQHWIRHKPITLEPEVPARDALALMREHGLRDLPVLARDGRLLGIVSIGDLRAALPRLVSSESPLSDAKNSISREYAIGELMTHAPFSLHVGTPIGLATRMLLKRRSSCLPVLANDGTLAGIFSEDDAFTALSVQLPAEGRATRAFCQLEELVRELRAERRRIVRRSSRRKEVKRETCALACERPTGPCDHAICRSAKALESSLADLAARRIVEIDHAIQRHQRGALGLCVACGETISLGRLRARPGADHCALCDRGSPERPSTCLNLSAKELTGSGSSGSVASSASESSPHRSSPEDPGADMADRKLSYTGKTEPARTHANSRG